MRSFPRRPSRLSGSSFKRRTGTAALAGSLLFTTAAATPALHAQAVSVNGGSIQGTITDDSGAAIPNAQVQMTSKEDGTKREFKTDAAGLYSIGPLNPGRYTLSVIAEGFQQLDVDTVIRVGTATPGTFKLKVGSSAEKVEVNAGAVQVNTDQPGVSGVITQEQIDSLPINGRSFLDLAQLEPGVQLQNGNTFDPTKAGYSALAVNGVSGRTTRILLDGQDITDENVGTTVFDVAEGAVGEFQINHSTQDVSGDLTSTGQVLVTTRSGTNNYHGTAFYNFQDQNAGFATFNNINPPFQRNQFGGGIGGPILKDKLFFFGEAERIKQDQSTAATLGSNFAAVQAAFPSIGTPYRETYSTGRLDWNGPLKGHYFVRSNYDVNSDPGGSTYSLYVNRDNTWGIAGGADFVNGAVSHSIRGSYEKFHNLIGDFTAGNASLYNPTAGLGLTGPLYYRFVAQNLYAGPNALAPQATYQSDKQIRYDGSWTKGKHSVRYGGEFNDIQGGGLASFYGLAPRATVVQSGLAAGRDRTDPLAYSLNALRLGNGQGYFSETPAFGLPAGGQNDFRIAFYLTDTWKVRPDLTLSAGLRYNRDTGRANQDVGPLPCSSINLTNLNGYVPCTSNQRILDLFGAGLGAQVSQPNLNFGPQVGFAYNVNGNSKTVVRGGFGIYYDSNVWNNILFDRENRLQNGLFNQRQDLSCTSSSPQITLPGGKVIKNSPDGTPFTQLCREPLRQSAEQLVSLQQQYQAATAAVGAAAPNPTYVGQTLTVNSAFYAPNYVSPYSIQVNFGLQQQLSTGLVLSVDYVHSSTLKIQQTVDLNHVGAARFLNKTAATNAINTTLTGFKTASIQGAIDAGATIADFQGNGLDSNNNVTGGFSPYYQGLTPDTAGAFPGQNPTLGVGMFNTPSGRAGYDALEVNLRQQQRHPFRGVDTSNFELSYTFSKSVTSSPGGSDAFFSQGSWNYDNPTQFIGFSDLDQRSQVSFGGSATVVHGPTIGLIGHFRSPMPSSLTMDNTSESNIFQTDVYGDGQTNSLIPGTNPGEFGRAIKGNALKRFIANYNATQAGKLTPAGQALVDAGLFTPGQLTQLNAVQQPLYVPSGSIFENPWFRTIDASVSYPIRLKKISETASITPGVAMYNVANLSNWTGATGDGTTAGTGRLLNVSNAGTGGENTLNFLNGENPYLQVKNINRVQRGSGTYDQGGLRSTEFQLRLNF